MSNLSPANEARLRAAIAERGLQSAEELIIASSVECAVLCTLGPDDYSKIGTSRYGGVPDLPDETWWPKTSDGKFFQFMMQVNLADVPDFVGNVLPRRGMLYCFMADYDEGRVIWANVEPASLKRAEEKASGALVGSEEVNLNPYQLEIRATINPPGWYSGTYRKIEDALRKLPGKEYDAAFDRYEKLVSKMRYQGDDNRGISQLLGLPAYIGYDPDQEAEGNAPPRSHNTLLLRLETCDAVNAMFGDAGYMQFFITGEALTAHDFSNVVAWLESS